MMIYIHITAFGNLNMYWDQKSSPNKPPSKNPSSASGSGYFYFLSSFLAYFFSSFFPASFFSAALGSAAPLAAGTEAEAPTFLTPLAINS